MIYDILKELRFPIAIKGIKHIINMEISKAELKELSDKIITDIEQEKEPVELLRECIEMMNKVISGEASPPDEETSYYFYNDFLYDIIKALLKSTHYKSEDVNLLWMLDD